MPNPPCELLISAALIATDFAHAALTDAAVAISDGTIVGVGDAAELRAYWQPQREVHLEQQLLTPGLVNAHTQLGMRLAGPDISRVSTEQLQLGIDLELLDLISHGITHIADASLVPGLVAARCAAAGMRAQITAPLADAANRFSDDAGKARTQTLELMDEWRLAPLISVAFGPGMAGPLADSHWAPMQTLADELDAPVQLKLDTDSAGLITQLDALGVLNPRLQMVLSTPIDHAEVNQLTERGVSIIHLPLASIDRSDLNSTLAALHAAGCQLALGTGDSQQTGAAQLLHAAAISQQQTPGIDAALALSQASQHGALALGSEASGISLGQPADLASFDLRAPALQPLSVTRADTATVLLRSGGLLASNVWINGEQVLTEQAHSTLNRTEILTRATQWQATMPP